MTIECSTATAVYRQPGRVAATALLEASGLPTADLTDRHMRHFFYCGPSHAPIGIVGLEFCGANALLRSLVVSPERRSTGVGADLVRHAENHAREQGAGAVYLLTTTADGFFRRIGYRDADRESAPAEIRGTREFASLCPTTASFLFKSLSCIHVKEDESSSA